MEAFLDKMAEILELDRAQVSPDTRFRGVEGWGSMVGFSMLITMEEDYNVKIPVDDFLKLETLGEIFQKTAK